MARYALGVITRFSARHYLIGGDFGPEGEPHGHDYRVEVVLEGDELDEHGFLVDIVKVDDALGRLAERYRDRILNELPELAGVNPGVEAFSRVFAESLRGGLDTAGLSALSVKIWENERAWAEYRLDLSAPE